MIGSEWGEEGIYVFPLAAALSGCGRRGVERLCEVVIEFVVVGGDVGVEFWVVDELELVVQRLSLDNVLDLVKDKGLCGLVKGFLVKDTEKDEALCVEEGNGVLDAEGSGRVEDGRVTDFELCFVSGGVVVVVLRRGRHCGGRVVVVVVVGCGMDVELVTVLWYFDCGSVS